MYTLYADEIAAVVSDVYFRKGLGVCFGSKLASLFCFPSVPNVAVFSSKLLG